jgi:hypothetical protein
MPSNNEELVLPKPTPERIDDDVDDRKNADSDGGFDDLEIYVDEDELEAEKTSKS